MYGDILYASSTHWSPWVEGTWVGGRETHFPTPGLFTWPFCLAREDLKHREIRGEACRTGAHIVRSFCSSGATSGWIVLKIHMQTSVMGHYLSPSIHCLYSFVWMCAICGSYMRNIFKDKFIELVPPKCSSGLFQWRNCSLAGLSAHWWSNPIVLFSEGSCLSDSRIPCFIHCLLILLLHIEMVWISVQLFSYLIRFFLFCLGCT